MPRDERVTYVFELSSPYCHLIMIQNKSGLLQPLKNNTYMLHIFINWTSEHQQIIKVVKHIPSLHIRELLVHNSSLAQTTNNNSNGESVKIEQPKGCTKSIDSAAPRCQRYLIIRQINVEHRENHGTWNLVKGLVNRMHGIWIKEDFVIDIRVVVYYTKVSPALTNQKFGLAYRDLLGHTTSCSSISFTLLKFCNLGCARRYGGDSTGVVSDNWLS